MPRFGPQVREVPRRRALAPRKFGLEPELPLPSGHAHSTRAVPQNPTTLCPIGPGFPACRGSSHKRGALPPLLWGAPSGCRGISRASRLREKAASGGVLVWNPKRRAPLRKAQAPIRLVWGQTDAAPEPKMLRSRIRKTTFAPLYACRGGFLGEWSLSRGSLVFLPGRGK